MSIHVHWFLPTTGDSRDIVGFGPTTVHRSPDIEYLSQVARAADHLGFEAVLTSVKHPPGPGNTWLGEVIVHSEDIRRPLGITHQYPTAAVVQVADFYQGSNLLIGAKRRIEGLTLRATDAAWSHGTGPEVSGPIISIVLAMTGRKTAADDLTGDGVTTLRARA